MRFDFICFFTILTEFNFIKKYEHVARPKIEPKPSTTISRNRPTVLPNKANRTTKGMKQTHHDPSVNIKPLLVNASTFNNWQKTLNLENLKKLIFSNNTSFLNNNDISDGNSNVLTTLASLAESSSSQSSSSTNTTTIATEALQWLEANGISSQEDTFFQSALENGHSVRLTEAGKLALMKDQNTTSNSSSKNSKVITIVADSTQLPQIINSTQSTPIVLVSGNESANRNLKRPQAKISKQMAITTTAGKHFLNNTKVITVSSAKDNLNIVDKEKEKLQKELELVRKQVEEYKTQLSLKDKELELYKKKLEAYQKNS